MSLSHPPPGGTRRLSTTETASFLLAPRQAQGPPLLSMVEGARTPCPFFSLLACTGTLPVPGKALGPPPPGAVQTAPPMPPPMHTPRLAPVGICAPPHTVSRSCYSALPPPPARMVGLLSACDGLLAAVLHQHRWPPGADKLRHAASLDRRAIINFLSGTPVPSPKNEKSMAYLWFCQPPSVARCFFFSPREALSPPPHLSTPLGHVSPPS